MRIDDEALRQRLFQGRISPAEPPADLAAAMARGLKPAAVLVGLHAQDGEDWLLFTRRTEHLRQHKGQISFPGGKFDSAEDEHLLDTALRESWEEVGILPNHVEVLGSLPPFDTISSYYLYPYVGRFPWPYDLRSNEDEISELIRVPLSHLRLPATYRSDQREYLGQRHVIHYYDYQAHTIWGITGLILYDFLRLLP